MMEEDEMTLLSALIRIIPACLYVITPVRVFFFIFLTAACAIAQMPTYLEQQILAMGPVINPPAMAALYKPLVSEHPPDADVYFRRDIRYGPDERNLVDVFTQKTFAKNRPVILFVHGGAFVRGDRRTGADSPFYDNIMLWAVRNGMVGVNMTYRLAPKNGWPSGPEDIGQAVKWVHDQIASYGGDPNCIFLMAHSTGAAHAGAYIAHKQFHQTLGSGLAGAILLSGIYRVTPELVEGNTTYSEYYGTDAAKYEDMSSVLGISKSKMPIFIGSSELDPPQFQEQTRTIISSMCEVGECPVTALFQKHNHMSEVYSISTEDHTVSDALLAFINQYAKKHPG
jgi:acetyl esterase/lipase